MDRQLARVAALLFFAGLSAGMFIGAHHLLLPWLHPTQALLLHLFGYDATSSHTILEQVRIVPFLLMADMLVVGIALTLWSLPAAVTFLLFRRHLLDPASAE